MLITKISTLTNIKRTLDIPVTQAQLDAWANGTLIQNAMPNLSIDDREFIQTGNTQEDWDEIL